MTWRRLVAPLCLLGAFGALSGCAHIDTGGGGDAAAIVTEAPLAPSAAILVALPEAPAAPQAAAPEPPPAPPAPRLARTRLDPLDDAARANLWERVRAGMGIADLDDERVRKWEQYYAARPDYVQRMAERGSRYLFHIVEEIERRNMPMDLALLPFIESAFDPQAYSRASASGMWQFMPGTGRDFELRQNVFRDDRRDVLASTRAALGYLQRLYTKFGDWHLALAAYNWGPGNVQKAIDRQQRAKAPADYASLRSMPNETRDYVRKLQAVKNIVLRPESFGLALPVIENHPFFVTLPIEHDIDVALVARLAGLSVEEFQQLNPQLNKPVILAAGTPQVLLPYDNANRFVRALDEHQGAKASWTAWVAPRTLKPGEAAKLTGMTESKLREVNRIPDRMLVRVGSTLLVSRTEQATANVSEHIADHAALSLAPEARPRHKAASKAPVKAGKATTPRRTASTTAAKATAKAAVKKPAVRASASSPPRAPAPKRT